MRMRIILSFLLSLLLLTGCDRNKNQQVSRPVIPVQIEVKISLSFPLGGTLTGVYVQNGQKVRKGTMVARVDDTSAKSLHDAALAMLNQAASTASGGGELLQEADHRRDPSTGGCRHLGFVWQPYGKNRLSTKWSKRKRCYDPTVRRWPWRKRTAVSPI